MTEDHLPNTDQGGEISAAALRQLNALLDAGPGENATDEEMDAFMAQIMALDGGAEAMKNLAEQIAEGGVLENLLPEGSDSAILYTPVKSPTRIVFRAHIQEGTSQVWRRFSLASDACFYDLHCALQDVFEWRSLEPHRFELREGGVTEVVFSSATEQSGEEEDYCEFQNRMVDLFREGCASYHYCLEEESLPEVLVAVEKVTADDSGVGKTPLSPRLLGGEGPKETFDLAEIAFRNPSQVLQFGVMPAHEEE